MERWRPANNGTGARIWFIYREVPAVHDRYGWDKRGRLRRFATYQAAERAATKANIGEAHE
jgi:hypothetical protein